MDIYGKRRRSLKAIVGSHHGAIADFARKHDIDAGFMSQLLSGHRIIGEKVARKLEGQLNLSSGSLDEPDMAGIGGDPLTEIETALDNAAWITDTDKTYLMGLVTLLRNR
jgi:hypothetical protein